jgi:putative FmdB family regulatory protein
MPLYEYKCNSCNKMFDVLQKMNEEPLKTCLYCNGHVEKLISSSSFQFKGNGWYVTDYKNNSSKTNGSNDNISLGKDKNATIK